MLGDGEVGVSPKGWGQNIYETFYVKKSFLCTFDRRISVIFLASSVPFPLKTVLVVTITLSAEKWF